MSNITIPQNLWNRLADLVQDMGNHHPLFRGTETGNDLDILGNAIKNCVPPFPGAELDAQRQLQLAAAEAVIAKHGGGKAHLSTIERAIETSEKLLGLWAD